jgi:MYXO-CTERM domain-containing protein
MDVKPARACVGPIIDYGHAKDMGPIPSQNVANNCVIGGLIPDGCGWAAPWNARYLFGDNGSGKIWSLDVNADRSGVTASSVKDFGSSQGVGSFRMGASGVLYIAEVSGGVVDKVTPKGLDPAMCGGSSGGAGGMGAGGAAAGSTSTGGVAGGSTGGRSNGGNSGTAPTGGRTGTSGGGGVPATGGSGTGGATGGTAPAMGGTAPAMGGTSTAGTKASGGSTTTAGNGAANAAGSGGSGGDDKSGCGCRVGGDAPSSTSLMALSGLLGLMAFRRRRSRAAR